MIVIAEQVVKINGWEKGLLIDNGAILQDYRFLIMAGMTLLNVFLVLYNFKYIKAGLKEIQRQSELTEIEIKKSFALVQPIIQFDFDSSLVNTYYWFSFKVVENPVSQLIFYYSLNNSDWKKATPWGKGIYLVDSVRNDGTGAPICEPSLNLSTKDIVKVKAQYVDRYFQEQWQIYKLENSSNISCELIPESASYGSQSNKS